MSDVLAGVILIISAFLISELFETPRLEELPDCNCIVIDKENLGFFGKGITVRHLDSDTTETEYFRLYGIAYNKVQEGDTIFQQ